MSVSAETIVQGLGLLMTAGSILFAAHTYRRQMNAQLFLEYTRRYEQIMESYPQNALGVRIHSDVHLPEESAALTRGVLRYLNLCSEEFYLWKSGYLSTRIWAIWERELQRTLASQLYRREWQKVACEFEAYPEFCGYVRASQNEASA